MKQTGQMQKETPQLSVKVGGAITKETYLEESLALPWMPIEPRVRREKLMVELARALEINALSFIMAPCGSGATSLAASVAHLMREQNKHIYYVSFAHFAAADLPEALAYIRSFITKDQARFQNSYLVLDDIQDMSEELVPFLSEELMLLKKYTHMLLILRPKAEILQEAFPTTCTLFPEDLMVAYDEIASFWPHVQTTSSHAVNAATFFAQTKGIASLADACYTDYVHKTTQTRRHEKEAIKKLLDAVISECELLEERRVAAAMLLLQKGSFADLQKLGIKHISEIAETFAKTYVLFGINMALEEFATISSELSVSCIQKIEAEFSELFAQTCAQLLLKNRISEALSLIRASKLGLDTPEYVNMLRTIDPLLLFNIGGSHIVSRIFQDTDKEKGDDVVAALIKETTVHLGHVELPDALKDFAALRKSFRTAKELPKNPLSSSFSPYFSKHYEFLRAFCEGMSFQTQVEAMQKESLPTRCGMIEKVVEAESLALYIASKREMDEQAETAYREICTFFERIHEEKLLLYTKLCIGMARICIHDFSRDLEALFEQVSTKAKREKDWLMAACALLGQSLWHYRYDFYILSSAEALQGLECAQKAEAPALEEAHLCLSELNSTFILHEDDCLHGRRKHPSAPFILYEALFSTRHKHDMHVHTAQFEAISHGPLSLLLLHLAIQKIDGAYKALWPVLPTSWRDAYKRAFETRSQVRKLIVHPQATLDLRDTEDLKSFSAHAHGTNILELHYLGGYHVMLDGHLIQPREFRRSASKHILEMLALESSHRISRDRLLSELWPTKSSEKAKNSLYAALSDLRRALGDNKIHAPHIICDKQYLCLNMDNTLVDLDLFQELLFELFKPGQDALSYIKAARQSIQFFQGGIQNHKDHPLYNLLFMKEKTLHAQFADALKVASTYAKDSGLVTEYLLFIEKAGQLAPSREDIFKMHVDALRLNNRMAEAEMAKERFAKKKFSSSPEEQVIFNKEIQNFA